MAKLAESSATYGERVFQSRRKWVLVLVGLALAFAIWGYIALTDKAVPLAWASQRGWKARSVFAITLEAGPLRKRILKQQWRDLPFSLSSEEKLDAKKCIYLAKTINATHNGVPIFNKDSTREAIEEILRNRPDYFYAEFLLGVWHRNHGGFEKSRDFFERAFEHAPVVIVQPYQSEHGGPLIGATVQVFGLECNHVKDGYLDPDLQLVYPSLVTDDDGCIYLPVYNTVYRRDRMSHPEGYSVDYPRLGWFASPGKVGVLPAAVVNRK
jgi:hypothetical protein